MCRLLYVRSRVPFEIRPHLEKLAVIAKNSKEYQGHGWGCAYLENGAWKIHKKVTPIWDEDLMEFGQTTVFLAHARSAFQDKDIGIQNNMPFHDNGYVFIFNGELRGVKINEKGRIGAEKIFNYIRRFDRGDMLAAMSKGINIIQKRTDYVRALNAIIADKQKAYVVSIFNEDPDYFTLRRKESDKLMVSSEPYPGESDWQSIPNNTISEI